MPSITFIQKPAFAVNFNVYDKQLKKIAKKEENQTTRKTARFIALLIPILMKSTGKALVETIRYSGTSFKLIVFGFYGPWETFKPPKDIYLLVFKVAYWALNLAWCTATTSLRLTKAELWPAPPPSTHLVFYADKELNTDHIYTKQIAIDMSEVSQGVQVNDLLNIYKDINFLDKGKIGYMAPTSRQEGKITYSIEDLQKNLQTFIDSVNSRKAFLGTPPAYDIPQLMAFYQQIEDAVRFSIDASNKKIAAFQAKNGKDVALYNPQTLNLYQGFLEDRARIAIDLAIAGKHCGARYMGEAMSIYENASGEALQHAGTLHDCLVELLAKKRYQIAKAQIQKHLGSDTHDYNKYIGHLGKILGLPGTENVIEHLDKNFNRSDFLKLFFYEYTPDAIIQTIHKEFKNSQVFREKVTDWIKDQVGDWQKKSYQNEAAKIIPQLLDILNHPVEQNNAQLQLFECLLKELNSKEIDLPLFDGNWKEYIEALFVSDSVKTWRDAIFTDDLVIQALEQKQPVFFQSPKAAQKPKIMLFKKEKIEALKTILLQATPTRKEIEKFHSLDKEKQIEQIKLFFHKGLSIQKLKKVILLESETVVRCMEEKQKGRDKKIREAVIAKKDLDRRNDFLAKIAELHIKEEKVTEEKTKFSMTPEIIEWLTVSQGIFKPQKTGESHA